MSTKTLSKTIPHHTSSKETSNILYKPTLYQKEKKHLKKKEPTVEKVQFRFLGMTVLE